VTIDDIVYVVDCGRAKIKMFDPQRNFATLKPEWISQGRQNCLSRVCTKLCNTKLRVISNQPFEILKFENSPLYFEFT
jgi:hypothetical protein